MQRVTALSVTSDRSFPRRFPENQKSSHANEQVWFWGGELQEQPAHHSAMFSGQSEKFRGEKVDKAKRRAGKSRRACYSQAFMQIEDCTWNKTVWIYYRGIPLTLPSVTFSSHEHTDLTLPCSTCCAWRQYFGNGAPLIVEDVPFLFGLLSYHFNIQIHVLHGPEKSSCLSRSTDCIGDVLRFDPERPNLLLTTHLSTWFASS